MLVPQHNAISRRTVAKGVAWATPALVIAGAAPAFAASRVCNYSVSFSTKEQQTEHQLTATSLEGNEITVTMTQAKFSGVASGSNMSIGTAYSKPNGACRFDTVGDYGDDGLVLNQAATSCTDGAAASQTVTFSFRDAAGNTVTPTSGTITIAGMSAQQSGNPDGRFNDQVTFSTGATLAGTGLSSAQEGRTWYPKGTQLSEAVSHTFSFVTMPTSLTFTSQRGPQAQAISITGFQFQAPC